jgi:DNA-binding NarL/FixJ family response regulator
MLAIAPCTELEMRDSDVEDASDLESAVRVLLQAGGEYPGRDDDLEPGMALEVCVDGQPYIVRIIASITADATRPHLSPRELDIARLITKGLPTKTVAATLGLRPCTVSTYTKRIYLKLNVNSRAEMVAKLLSEHSLRFYPARDSEIQMRL